MKKFRRLAGLCGLGMMSIMVHVDGQPCASETWAYPCSSSAQCCFQGIEAFGQALYWKYTGTWTKITRNNSINLGPNLIKQDITSYNYDAQWGYRVGLGWNPVNRCVYSELSYLRLNKQRDVSGVGITEGSFFNIIGLVTGQMGVEYQNIDFTVGTYFYRCGCLAMHVYGGSRWLFLRETADLNPPTTFGIAYVYDRSKYNAGAFKVGGGADLNWHCLKVFGAIDVLGTFGVQRSGFFHSQPGAPAAALVFRPPEVDSLRIATGIGAKLGVKCDYALCCWCFSAELGFEIQNYFDVLRATVREGDIIRALSNGDAGFGGPYGSLKVSY